MWRESKQELLPLVQPTKPQGIRIHLWDVLSLDSSTDLVVLEGNVRSLPSRVTLGNCILQDDNPPSHRSAAVIEKKQELDLRPTDGPVLLI